MEIYVYPDMELYDEPPSWKSDDYVSINEETTIGYILQRFTPEETTQIMNYYLGNG